MWISTGFYMCHRSGPISMLLMFVLGWSFRVYFQIMSELSHVFKQLFFSGVSTPVVLPLHVNIVLFNKSLIIVLDQCITTAYQPLCTMFFWFCSFHSASIPGGHSSSHRISPVHYSFQHNSIPSPAYTTICSAIPQSRDTRSFFNFFCHHKECDYKYCCTQRNNELEEFYVNWSDLQELMQSERSRTRRTLYTETDTLWNNQT